MRERVTGWNWYWVCVASWLSMMGAWAAAADVLGRPEFTLWCGAILVGAFPFAYYLRFSKTSRSVVNMVVLAAAVGLGILEVNANWLPNIGLLATSLGGSYQALIAAFMWVMVFRSFAIRNEHDAAETTLAVGSILVLVLVSDPQVIAAIATAVSLLGCVAVLAANHEVTWTPIRAKLHSTSRRAPATHRTANSWQTLYIIGLLCAFIASQGFRSMDITTTLGRALQIRLARMMFMASLQQYQSYVTADARLYMFGPWPAGNHPLFEVKTDSPINWRLATYSDYEGRWWTQDFRTIRHGKAIARDTWQLPIPDGAGKAQSGDPMTFTVTARMPMGGTAPAAYWPRQVSIPRIRPRVDAAGALWTAGYLQPGESYTVTASRPRAGEEPRDISPRMRMLCLRLPQELPTRVRELARSLTVGKKDPVQKVAALQAYLNANCQYDLNATMPPVDRDLVDYFIFEGRRGHCVYFASALVVMARCVGLPARLVSGFLEGEPQEDSAVYLVRQKDAHAWAEVFIPGDGWKEFDPTPGRPSTASEVAAQTWDKIVSAMGKGFMSAVRWAAYNLGGALLILAFLTVGVWGFRRWRWAQMMRVRLLGAAPSAQVEWAYRQMLRWLAEAGAPKPMPVTPLEHVRGLDAEWDAVRRQAADLSYRYYKANYSAGGVEPKDAGLAVLDAETVRDHWLDLRRQKAAERTKAD
jgi:hypothetical protein